MVTLVEAMRHSIFDKLSSINNNPWLIHNLVFLIRHGSMAYGTNVEGSDEDFRGATLAPAEYYTGFSKHFEQQEIKDPDTAIYDLKKFFALGINNNPNILETLFVDEEDIIFVSDAGKLIFEAKDKFLSKRIRFTFGGYCVGQIKKLQAHRNFLLNPIHEKPLRSDFGLDEKPEIPMNQLLAIKSEIAKELQKYTLGHLDDLRDDQKIAVQNSMYDIFAELKITKDDLYLSACRKIGMSDNFIHYMHKERIYENKKHEYDQFSEWKKHRNKKRAELEEKWTYDTKFAYHCVRLLRSCQEALETCKLQVKRPDKDELIFIRNGGWSFEKLFEYFETELKKLDSLCAKSKLPDKPDSKYLESLCSKIIKEHIVKSS